MPSKVAERRIGRAGGIRQRTERQRHWDQKYGEGNWEIGYVVNGEFITQEAALETIYYRSYEQHFSLHPSDLEELVGRAKVLHNRHAEATTGVDLQVPAILDYLRRHNLALSGSEVVDIGSWEGKASHPISIRLSPLSVRVIGDPKTTLEKYWQENKCLANWTDG